MSVNLNDFHTLVFDFDGVFTNNKVIFNAEGEEFVVCDRRDGLSFNFMRKAQEKGVFGLDVFVLSKEPNPVVLSRTKKLKLHCNHGIDDKLTFMKEYFQEHRPNDKKPFDGLIYVGNDLNDLAVMRRAGYSVAPNDAHPVIKSIASEVFPENGGDHFIRSFMEKLLGLEGLSPEQLEEWI